MKNIRPNTVQKLAKVLSNISSSVEKENVEEIFSPKKIKVLNDKVMDICSRYCDEVEAIAGIDKSYLGEDYDLAELLNSALGKKVPRGLKKGLEDIILIMLFAGDSGLKNLYIEANDTLDEDEMLANEESLVLKSLKATDP